MQKAKRENLLLVSIEQNVFRKVLVPEKNKVNKYTDEDIEKLNKKLSAQFAKGMEIGKIAKAYSLEEVKLIAKKHEIEADPKDTVKDILEVLLEDFEENKE